MKHIHLIVAVTFFFSVCVSAQPTVRLSSPRVFEDLEAKLAAEPSISAERLAVLGNRLSDKQGYGFIFDPGSFKERIVKVPGKSLARYDLTTTSGTKMRFLTAERGDHPCGTWAEFPVSRVKGNVFTLISAGKLYETLLPRQFATDEIVLVDRSLRRTVRRWTVPLDRTPEGISRDGKKIYVPTELDQLFLEIDATGRYRFAAANGTGIIKNGVELTKFPKDKQNDYLGFRHFKAGKADYFVKFSHPCT